MDYDNPGDDVAQFIEIYNGSDSDFDLAAERGARLALFNRAEGAYRIIGLGTVGTLPRGGFLVVATADVPIAEGALRVVPDPLPAEGNGWIEHGPEPELGGVALINDADILSTFGWGGNRSAQLTDGRVFELAPNASEELLDSATSARSLVRRRDGVDTGNAADDLAAVATPTPGAPNSRDFIEP